MKFLDQLHLFSYTPDAHRKEIIPQQQHREPDYIYKTSLKTFRK